MTLGVGPHTGIHHGTVGMAVDTGATTTDMRDTREITKLATVVVVRGSFTVSAARWAETPVGPMTASEIKIEGMIALALGRLTEVY